MAFVSNEGQQISFEDPYYRLSERQRRYLKESWAAYFAEHIFPNINESRFAKLYSDRPSRPNIPVNILVGALLIRELSGESDQEFLRSLLFDFRYQYALHTSSYREQPLTERTLGRFRMRCVSYEKECGEDLLRETVEELAQDLSLMLGMDRSFRRRRSWELAEDIHRAGSLELFWACTANLLKEMDAMGVDYPADLNRYCREEDRILALSYNRPDDTAKEMALIREDAVKALALCDDRFDESSSFLLLKRVLRENPPETV